MKQKLHSVKQSRLYQFIFPTKLGLVSGVVIPSTLNILGVILFLRMSQIVGQVGFLWSLVLLAISYSINVFTILSLSAMATNGQMKGGGAYYIVSRSLGSEFGVSTAVMLFVANAFGGVLDMMGFCEALLVNFPVLKFASNYVNTIVFNSVLLLIIIGIGMTGAGVFSKLSYFNVILITASIGTMFVTLIAQRPGTFGGAYTGWSASTFRENLTPSGTGFSFSRLSTALGVFYPACSGYLGGFNMSSDLRRPEKDLPRGSLLACLITATIYFLFMFSLCFTVKQSVLADNSSIMGDLSLFRPLQVTGILTSTFCASFMSYISCSRILQALAKDKVVPFITPLAKGFGKNNEPLVALAFTWLVAQCIVFMGRIDFVAPFVSLAFIIVYFMNNLACLTTFVAWIPNFRPRFKLFSWWTALLGMIITAAALFSINPLYASIEFVIVVALLIAVWIYSPAKSFGQIGKSVLFFQIRKQMLKTDSRNSHVKHWRFKPLVLCPNPRSVNSFHTLAFFHSVSKHRGGLATFAKIDTRDFRVTFNEHETESNAMYSLALAANWSMYGSRTYSSSIREGVRSLLINGHDMMRPNTLVLGFHDETPPQQCIINTKTPKGKKIQEALSHFPPLPDRVKHNLSLDEWMECIKDTLILRRNFLITRHFHKFAEMNLSPPCLHQRLMRKKHRYIDVWIFVLNEDEEELEPTISLTLQLAFLMKQSNEWRKYHKVRVLMIADYTTDCKVEKKKVKSMLKMARIDAKVRVIHVGPEDFSILERLRKDADSYTTETTLSKAAAGLLAPEDIDVTFDGVKTVDVSAAYETADDMTRPSLDICENSGSFARSKTFPATKRESQALRISKSLSLEFVKKSVSIDDHHELEFPSSVHLRAIDGSPLTEMEKFTVLNHIIKGFSSEKTSLVLMTLPAPPSRFDDSFHNQYHECLKLLTNDLPCTILVYGFEQTISQSL